MTHYNYTVGVLQCAHIGFWWVFIHGEEQKTKFTELTGDGDDGDDDEEEAPTHPQENQI